MALFTLSNVQISGIAAAIPKHQVSNKDLMGMSDVEKEILIDTTGIDTRRVADDSTCASDLCADAARRLLDEINWKADEIDVLIFVTQTPDYLIPGNSMLLQETLGLPKTCMALDINQGCAGYVYGLSVIAGLMSASGLKKGLLLVGDAITKIIDKNDNSTHPIFSDAGSATALEFNTEAADMHFNLQTDGSKHEAISLKEGGARMNTSEAGFMRMRGHEIFTFGLREVAPNIQELLRFGKAEFNEIDYFVFHQANRLLNESIRKKLDVATEKVPSTLEKFGNTSCATIPVTMVSEISNALQQGKQQLVLSGFGVGLSWGSAIVYIDACVCPELIERP